MNLYHLMIKRVGIFYYSLVTIHSFFYENLSDIPKCKYKRLPFKAVSFWLYNHLPPLISNVILIFQLRIAGS